MKWANGYFSLLQGTNLAIEQMGEIMFEDIDISTDIVKSETLRLITLQKKDDAHMMVNILIFIQV